MPTVAFKIKRIRIKFCILLFFSAFFAHAQNKININLAKNQRAYLNDIYTTIEKTETEVYITCRIQCAAIKNIKKIVITNSMLYDLVKSDVTNKKEYFYLVRTLLEKNKVLPFEKCKGLDDFYIDSTLYKKISRLRLDQVIDNFFDGSVLKESLPQQQRNAVILFMFNHKALVLVSELTGETILGNGKI